MRKFLKNLLGPFLTRIASNASAPDRKLVFKSLSKLLNTIKKKRTSRGIILRLDFKKTPVIIFSDMHKGNKDPGDDFASNEKNYLAALDYYYSAGFTYVNLGDSEELWKYKPEQVIPKNMENFKLEDKFRELNRFYKTFGNHDLKWKNKLDVAFWFKKIFKLPLTVWEGLVLITKINGKELSFFLTHGHQGDKMSDNNAFSTWVVANIWTPLQRYLQINVNTPSKDFKLRDKHNMMMYEWSSRLKDLVLITGHTHKPVFASGKYTDPQKKELQSTPFQVLEQTTEVKPSYFNSGCCCYNTGDITGIELEDNYIRLIQWRWDNDKMQSLRAILEEMKLTELITQL